MLPRLRQTFLPSGNSIFGKIGSIASEESLLQLINGKCLPIFWRLFLRPAHILVRQEFAEKELHGYSSV